jgi:predicted DNA-binding transcriptional regulator YafY
VEKPTQRVLAALELLQAHPRLGGAELSRRLGVDRRTVRRYIAHLEAMGIPIRTERGPDGCYALMPGFKLPPMLFNGDEAVALAMGLRIVRDIGLPGLAAAVASAQAKLERVLPKTTRRRMRAIDETVVMELSRPFAAGASAAVVDLAAAAHARQRVHLHYRSAQLSESERDFDPYGVAYRGGAWYTVGWCHLRADVRSFRLDRIVSVVPLPLSFGRPDDFDLLAHLTESIAALPRTHAIDVLLDTTLAVARREIFGAIGTLAQADEGVVLRAQADDLDWFARELARLPFAFRIREPAALAVALRRHATALARCVRRPWAH